MTKEEVAGIVAYCTENNISQKQRLAELGISEWQFYSSKRKYAPKRGGDNAGEFLQLVPGGAFLPDPIKPARSRSVRQKEADRGAVSVSVELTALGDISSTKIRTALSAGDVVPLSCLKD